MKLRNILRYFFFAASLLPLSLRPQSLKEMAERPWWGIGRFETELVLNGLIIVSYEMKELSVDAQNRVTARLSEKIVLEGARYGRTLLVAGTAKPENLSMELKEQRALAADKLPEPFEWPVSSFSLHIGYDRERPSGFMMKGDAEWGTLKGQAEFKDFNYATH